MRENKKTKIGTESEFEKRRDSHISIQIIICRFVKNDSYLNDVDQPGGFDP